MKIPLTILALVAVALLAFFVLPRAPDRDALTPRTDLPWQIAMRADGSSRVFDLELGRATLADAMGKFGALEGLAVFESRHGHMSLEGYFGNVQLGPLRAKIVVGVAATPQELAELKGRAVRRKGSPTGDWKHQLNDPPELHQDRKITVISYVPGPRNLDAAFFRERFGEPVARLRENERAVSWFYPDRGLSILIDDEAREVLEYVAPRDFVMPEGVTATGTGGP